MKNILYITSSAVFLILTITIPVFAQSSIPSRTPTPTRTQNSSQSNHEQENQQRRLDSMKHSGINNIDHTIDNFHRNSDRISSSKKLTNDQKTQLINKINELIAALNQLSANLDSENNPDIIKSDIDNARQSSNNSQKNILISENHLGNANVLNNFVNALDNYANKLQTAINEAKNRGQDTGDLDSLLADMQSHINNAKNTLNNITNNSLAIDTTISADTTITSNSISSDRTRSTQIDTSNSNGDIHNVANDIQEAKKDGAKIAAGLFKLYREFLRFEPFNHTFNDNGLTPFPSQFPIPTPFPTPTPF